MAENEVIPISFYVYEVEEYTIYSAIDYMGEPLKHRDRDLDETEYRRGEKPIGEITIPHKLYDEGTPMLIVEKEILFNAIDDYVGKGKRLTSFETPNEDKIIYNLFDYKGMVLQLVEIE